MSRRIAIYPGSFDPITSGHCNIIDRSLEIFDEVVVGVLNNAEKKALFTAEERVDLVRSVYADQGRVQVESFDGLLVDYVGQRGASTVIRGLRAVQDFEYEFQMTMMNRRLAPKIDTVFMMTDEEYFYISSRTVKEVASLGGNIDGLVPPLVQERMAVKLAAMGGNS
ncbi:MAG: pantetheine-phosphate adenylyltransferase [Myxococcota bacterium]|nr:pantetheine-phosphate adenylyltransferase [Myxococcota bacterium]